MAKRKPNQLESNTPDSSMNALKHGLYARKWINPEEQELYDALFDEYCAYYEPVGAPEYTLIESMVASRVKVLRFHAIEEANLDLAQSKATDPQHFLDSLGLDNDGMKKEFAALLCGSYRPPEGGLEHELINELARTPTFEISGWKNPTSTPEAILTMKRIQRLKGCWQKQASPLTQTVSTKLLEVCDDSVAGQRNRVLLHLGYETMRRRSEMCSFRFEDLVLNPNGKVGIRLNYSKTDQFGAGKLIPISKGLHELINDWKQIAIDGHILRGIKPNGALTQKLSPGSISIILQNLQSSAGLNIEPPLSGHSFRVGRALDLLEAGESLPKIMLRGGWKTESSVIKYLRAWELD